jgi:hypothetical protein
MGQQLHPGGMDSSLDRAERAGIGEGQTGIDLCCGVGGRMRVLMRFRNVASMIGVDATQRNIERAKATCREEGFGERRPGDRGGDPAGGLKAANVAVYGNA